MITWPLAEHVVIVTCRGTLNVNTCHAAISNCHKKRIFAMISVIARSFEDRSVIAFTPCCSKLTTISIRMRAFWRVGSALKRTSNGVSSICSPNLFDNCFTGTRPPPPTPANCVTNEQHFPSCGSGSVSGVFLYVSKSRTSFCLSLYSFSLSHRSTFPTIYVKCFVCSTHEPRRSQRFPPNIV